MQQVELTREHHSAITVDGIRFATVFERDADERSPLLVLLHGRGDTAAGFRASWRDFPVKLQLSLPLAPEPYGETGERQWFAWPPGMAEDALAAAVLRAEARLWPALTGLAKGRRVMVGGFSQGALVAYAMAVKHPDVIACAFPIGGRLPAIALPRGAQGDGAIAPIVALHGTQDERIPIEDDRASIALLVAAGASAELIELPGTGHVITPAVVEALATQVRMRLPR